MKLGAEVTVGKYIVHSMIPDWIGNTMSACFFLAGSYAFCYGTLPMRIERIWLRMRGKSQPQHSEIHESHAHGISSGHDLQHHNGSFPTDAAKGPSHRI